MSELPVPCCDCTDRRVGCHGKCDKYKKFRKELKHMNIITRSKIPWKIEFQNNQKRRAYERQKNRLY